MQVSKKSSKKSSQKFFHRAVHPFDQVAAPVHLQKSYAVYLFLVLVIKVKMQTMKMMKYMTITKEKVQKEGEQGTFAGNSFQDLDLLEDQAKDLTLLADQPEDLVPPFE